MKKKWRVVAVIGGVVALIAVGAVFYANREHADYVRAAKLLPTARQEAEAMFGPLTWEEYRKEKGISGEADLEEWTTIAKSVPTTISAQWSLPPEDSDQWKTSPYSLTSRERFLAERVWFSQIGDRVDRLRFRHIMRDDGSDWDFRFIGRSTDIAKALRIGLIGAADDGNADAVLELGRAFNSVIAELAVEPSGLANLKADAFRTLLLLGVLRAAVRNRNDVAVMRSLMTVVLEYPPAPTVREAFAADARMVDVYLEQLRNLEPGEINSWFNDVVGDYEFLEEMMDPSLMKLYDLVEKFRGERPEYRRKTGRRTAAALEARHWQVLVEYTNLLEDIARNKPGARAAMIKLDDEILFGGDWSYELANSMHWSWFFELRIRNLFGERAARSAFELLSRFPDYPDLPDELPPDLVFADPFGGLPVLYRKTQTGFLIYTRYENLIDDGFPLDDPDQLREEVRLMFSSGTEDFGLTVSYDPITPMPWAP
ncbi:MAG: hypothetical protein IH944_12830 [Armatimonadetes bacterium]|nr:hypothetical protein [Armatimonadota bacterium]